MESAGMAGPCLALPDRPLRPEEFADYPVLEQSLGSSKNHFHPAWQASHGFRFNRVFSTDHLGVLGELTIRGLGISQLSLAYFSVEIEQGLLRMVPSDPMLPPMAYSAVYRNDDFNTATDRIVALAVQRCDCTQHAGSGRQACGPAAARLD